MPQCVMRVFFHRRPGVPPRKAIVGSPAAPDDLPSSDDESSSDDDKSKIISPAKEVSANDTPNISFQVRPLFVLPYKDVLWNLGTMLLAATALLVWKPLSIDPL